MGLVIDLFANTLLVRMAAACTLVGFLRAPLINVMMGNELPGRCLSLFQGVWLRWVFPFFVVYHRIASCGPVQYRVAHLFGSALHAAAYRGQCGAYGARDFIVEAFNIESHRIDG